MFSRLCHTGRRKALAGKEKKKAESQVLKLEPLPGSRSLQHRLDVLLGCRVSKQPGCSSLLSPDPDPHCSLKQPQLNCH